MSWYLAIDTATDVGSVALGVPGRPEAEMLIASRQHASALIPSILSLLGSAGLTMGDVAGLLVADGPGSFTGLRIAWASAKGIALARGNVTLAAAPSLMGAAWVAGRRGAKTVAAVYDALRGEVFGALYRIAAGSVEILLPPALTTLADLTAGAVARHAVPELAVSDAPALREALEQWTGRAPLIPPAGGPRASALLELMVVPGAVTSVERPDAFEPEYGRLAEAQVQWERTHGTRLRDSGGDYR